MHGPVERARGGAFLFGALLAGCYASHGPAGPVAYTLVAKDALRGAWSYTALDEAGAVRAGPLTVRFSVDEDYLVTYVEAEPPPDDAGSASWVLLVPIEAHVADASDGCGVLGTDPCDLTEPPGPRWYERRLARLDWSIVHVDPARVALPDATRPIHLDADERIDPMLAGERDGAGRLAGFDVPARYDCDRRCEAMLVHRFTRR